MTTTLLRNGRIHGASPTPRTALAVYGDRIVFVGTDDQAARYDGADEVVDLQGRWVAPAFVDAHVHTVQTGDLLSGLDLTTATSHADLLDRVAVAAGGAAPDSLLVGQGWDETTWPEPRVPTAAELDRATGGRRLCLGRIDGHSTLASAALLAAAPGIEALAGYTPEGWLEGDAKQAITDLLADLVPMTQRAAAARVALREMARLGVGAFHECAAPHIGPAEEIAVVRAAAEEIGLHGTYYWGALGAFDDIERLGVAGLAGDLNADGAVGSRSAAMRTAYDDAPHHCGHAYLDAGQIAEHVIGCTERGVQAGFHCIGDAALDAVLEGFRKAVERLGGEAVARCGHRLEHVEMPTPELLSFMREHRMTASVQPMFDGLWGGPDGMYAERLGERWRAVNPFADFARSGTDLALGSDSPVTSLDPWGAVRAAVAHRTPGQSIGVDEALRAHTRNGWRAAGIDDAGDLEPGRRATYAVWEGVDSGDDGQPTLAPDGPSPLCTRTVVEGRTVFDRDLEREDLP